MKVKSLLLLLLLIGCSKSNQVGDVSADANTDCDGVCVVEMSADTTQTADVPQSVSPSTDTTETKIYEAVKDIQEKLDYLTAED